MRLLWFFLLTVSAFGQTLDQFSPTVVLLYKTEQREDTRSGIEQQVKYGTGFLIAPDDNTLMVVTAEHVASMMASDFRATLLGDNDTPFDVSSKEQMGTKDVRWISHGTADVAVASMQPTESILLKLKGHFLRMSTLSRVSVIAQTA